MKVKFSPLKLNDFELLQSHFDFHVPKEDEVDVSSLFNSYSVEIDFEHNFLDDDKIQVFVNIGVNQLKKPKSGYILFAEGMGMFEIQNQDKIKPEQVGNLRLYSTLNMMINNLRNIMFQTSNIGPMGGYLLPPVDILDLFQKKKKQKPVTTTKKK
jgi:preprotein translocase subunit SecB